MPQKWSASAAGSMVKKQKDQLQILRGPTLSLRRFVSGTCPGHHHQLSETASGETVPHGAHESALIDATHTKSGPCADMNSGNPALIAQPGPKRSARPGSGATALDGRAVTANRGTASVFASGLFNGLTCEPPQHRPFFRILNELPRPICGGSSTSP